MLHASAEGASEKFSVFYRGTAYDVIVRVVIVFKFQGGIRKARENHAIFAAFWN